MCSVPIGLIFLSKKSLIAAKNEMKEKSWTEEEETHN
jgi:hypothetical protein